MQLDMLQHSQSAIIFADSHLSMILEARDLEDLIGEVLQIVHQMRCQHRLFHRYHTHAVCCPDHGFERSKESNQRSQIAPRRLWRDKLVKVGQKQAEDAIVILLRQIVLDLFTDVFPERHQTRLCVLLIVGHVNHVVLFLQLMRRQVHHRVAHRLRVIVPKDQVSHLLFHRFAGGCHAEHLLFKHILVAPGNLKFI